MAIQIKNFFCENFNEMSSDIPILCLFSSVELSNVSLMNYKCGGFSILNKSVSIQRLIGLLKFGSIGSIILTKRSLKITWSNWLYFQPSGPLLVPIF